MPDDQIEASTVEQENSGAPTAIFANRVFVTVDLDVTRLSFGEQTTADGPIRYRTAVVLRSSDAVQLRDILSNLIERAKNSVAGQTGNVDDKKT